MKPGNLHHGGRGSGAAVRKEVLQDLCDDAIHESLRPLSSEAFMAPSMSDSSMLTMLTLVRMVESFRCCFLRLHGCHYSIPASDLTVRLRIHGSGSADRASSALKGAGDVCSDWYPVIALTPLQVHDAGD